MAGHPPPRELVRQPNGEAARSYADRSRRAEPDGELLGAKTRPEVVSEAAPQRIDIGLRGTEKVRTHRAPIRPKTALWRQAARGLDGPSFFPHRRGFSGHDGLLRRIVR